MENKKPNYKILGKLTLNVSEWVEYFKSESAQIEYEKLVPQKLTFTQNGRNEEIWNPRYNICSVRTTVGESYMIKNPPSRFIADSVSS